LQAELQLAEETDAFIELAYGVRRQPIAVTIIVSRVGLRGQGMASRVRVNAQTYSTIGRSPERL
jgi:hypothetical protein